MSPSRDPFELLQALAPRLDRDAPATPAEDAVLQRILDALDAPRAPRRRRWWRGRALAGLLGVGIVGVASAGAAVWYETSRPEQPVSVTCWRDVDRSSQWETQIGPNESPVDACAPAWRDGPFGPAAPPSLIACTAAEGPIAVVPGDSLDACAAVGLPALDPGHAGSPELAEVHLLQRLVADPLGATCATEEETVALVAEVLARHRIDGWTVNPPAPFTAGRPCGQVAIDPATRTLDIISLRQP